MSNNHPWEVKRGLLLAVAAPSGAGKTTLCTRMAERFPALQYAISYTTRTPREGEVNGDDYHFVDATRFKEMVGHGSFLEWAEVHGNFYGTPKKELEDMLADGIDVLLDMDVQGVESLKALDVDAVCCLILPPSFGELKKRLQGRGKDSVEAIDRRLTIAVKELAKIELFDYVIVNDDLDVATESLESIIRSEHVRRQRIGRGWFRKTFFP